ncbi:MAG: hypothetical protein ABI840_09910 [bacterium]
MNTNCSSKSERDYQSISFNQFKKNFNLVDLKTKFGKSFSADTVHYYILTTVKFEDGTFRQTGSGPNLEGDLITLCTCKHKMRAGNIEKGDWIAGIISRNKTKIKEKEARNCLFYLIRIKKLFDNQLDLQNYLQQEYPNSLKMKYATENKLGDIFLMKNNNEDYHDVKNFVLPIGHCHYKNEKWHEDIEQYEYEYNKHNKSPHKLVVANTDYSYVWSIPKIGLKEEYQNLYQGNKKSDLKDFLQELELRKN